MCNGGRAEIKADDVHGVIPAEPSGGGGLFGVGGQARRPAAPSHGLWPFYSFFTNASGKPRSRNQVRSVPLSARLSGPMTTRKERAPGACGERTRVG